MCHDRDPGNALNCLPFGGTCGTSPCNAKVASDGLSDYDHTCKNVYKADSYHRNDEQ